MGAHWSYRAGDYGSTVYVRQAAPNGRIHMGVYDPSIGGTRWWSLGHADQERAAQECHEKHLELRRG
jgi:hypothetical protein